MIYIYARVSTDKQETDNQTHSLKLAYPDGILVEETSSGYKEKPVLNALLPRLSAGDTLVVSALDRLGRHAQKALKLVEELSAKGIKLVSIREGIDTATSSGKFVATCMFGLAEMERNLISERTKATLARMKSEGVILGRPRTIPDEVIELILAYRSSGCTIKQISELAGVSTGRVCQLLQTLRRPV